MPGPTLALLVLAFFGERFPVGPLGLEAEVEAGAATAIVRSIADDGPGRRAGLELGDAIVAVDGHRFSAHSASVDDGGRGPQKELGETLDAALRRAAQEAEPAPAVTLTVLRSDAEHDVSVPFPWRAPLSGPRRAEGRLALRRAAAEQLCRSQEANGSFDSPVGLTGDRVITAFALVALLAHGDPNQAAVCDAAAAWLHGPDDLGWLPDPKERGPDSLDNWALATTMLALAEHDAARGATNHTAVLRHLGSALVARMDPTGLFGHDVGVGYVDKGFNVINALAALGWAAAEGAGVPVDEPAWELCVAQLTASLDPDGGVRYWTMPGTGTADASLRTGALALALHLRRREPEVHARLVHYLDTHAARAREAHAVGSLGLLVDAAALASADREAYERFLEEWRWYLTLSYADDGRVRYLGGKGNNGGDSYLGFDDVAAVIALQLLSSEDGRLSIDRKPRGS